MEEATNKESPTGKDKGFNKGIEQNKDSVSPVEKQTINPSFEPLKNPETLQNPNPFSNQEQDPPAKVRTILNQLLKTVEPVDFEGKAFPQIKQLREDAGKLEILCKNPDGSYNTEGQKTEWEKLKNINKQIERFKITEKHLLILTIEELLKLAESNDWGMCNNQAFIYLYNGQFWVKVISDEFQSFLGKTAEKMGVGKFSARWFGFKEKLIKQFFAEAYFPMPETQDKVLINLKNKTFEITPQERIERPFDRYDFLTYQLPFEYNPKATAPKFEKFLNQVLPDKERQNILSEFLGYVFIKTSFLKLEKALLLYGSGRNGKSVIYDIVTAMLGKENVCSYSLESLTDTSGYYRAMIADKLVNYASEISTKANPGFFKALASGEPVEARLPYKDPFEISNYAKLVFNLNELPRDVEHTHAYFERFLIIPFEVTIPEKEQDKQLAKKIIETELSGVFNWVLQGLERLLQNKRFTDCKASEIAREEYKTNTDSVKLFIEENSYKPSEAGKVLLKELYLKYRTFCIEDGFKYPVNKQSFKRRLQGMGFVIEKMNTGNNVFIETTETPF